MMNDDSLYVPYLWLALGLALAALILGHLVMFLAYYSDTLAPTTLPYYEEFTDLERLDYRQYGGRWRLQDETLVQFDTQDTDLFAVVPNLTVDPETAYYFSAKMRILAGPKGGGLLFNLQNSDTVQSSHLVRFGSDNGQDYLVYGYFDDDRQFKAQGSVPPEIGEEAELGVALHDGVYDLFVNGRRVAENIPLEYQGGHLAVTTWFSSVAFDDVYAASAVPPLPAALGGADPAPAAAPVVDAPAAPAPAPVEAAAAPAEEGAASDATAARIMTGNTLQLLPHLATDGNPSADPFEQAGRLNRYFDYQFGVETDQSQWRVLAGDWRLGNEGLVQLNTTSFDNVIVHADQYTNYTMRAALQHLDGIGGGVLFNMPPGSTAKSGHMVRYMEEGIVAWGYFDDQGVFQGQGSANVPTSGEDVHTFEVAIGPASYTILLDGILLGENVPLIIDQGRIGLTASRSVVAFKELAVTTLETAPSTD
ncbi:MAG: hypothetical protein KDD78_01415 [Caldilineaceae bacterium]|nr:hypothetical protein [Caldilineaceae bacterium]